jgi:putative transposase
MPKDLPSSPQQHDNRQAVLLHHTLQLSSGHTNAAAEAFFSSLEWEVLSRHEFATTRAAQAVVMDWCYGFYNHRRRHSAAAGLSPINYETATLNRDAA